MKKETSYVYEAGLKGILLNIAIRTFVTDSME